MKSWRVGLGITLLAGEFLALPAYGVEKGEPSAIQVGAGFFYPSVAVELIHDDNIYLQQDNEKSSFITVLSPKASLVFEGEASEIGFNAELDHGSYLSSHADDYLDVRLLAEGSWLPTERVMLYGSLGYRGEHEARGTSGLLGPAALTFAEPDEFDVVELTGRFRYGLDVPKAPRFEIEYNHEDRGYQNNRSATFLQDRTQDRLKGTFFYRVMPNTSLLLEGTVTQFDYDVAFLDSDQYRLLAGLTWEATFQTEGFLKLGWGEKKFDSTLREDGSEASWEIGVNWEPLSYSRFTLAAARDFAESDGIGDFVDSSQLSLTWNHDWYSFMGTRVILTSGNDQYIGSNQEDDILELQLRVDYRPRPWLVFGVGVTHSERQSNVVGLDYKSNVLGLQMGINM